MSATESKTSGQAENIEHKRPVLRRARSSKAVRREWKTRRAKPVRGEGSTKGKRNTKRRIATRSGAARGIIGGKKGRFSGAHDGDTGIGFGSGVRSRSI